MLIDKDWVEATGHFLFVESICFNIKKTTLCSWLPVLQSQYQVFDDIIIQTPAVY